MSWRVLLLATTALAGCRGSKAAATDARPAPSIFAADPAAMCADLAQAVSAATTDFADLRTTVPTLRGRHAGVAARRTLRGAQQCAIVHGDDEDPQDTMECDLADATTLDDAEAVLASWEAQIAGCAVVQDWFSKPKGGGVHLWESETLDDHLLVVKLHLAGDDPEVRPLLRVSRPEL